MRKLPSFELDEFSEFIDTLPVVTLQVVVTANRWYFSYVSAQVEKMLGTSAAALLEDSQLFIRQMPKSHGRIFKSTIRSLQFNTNMVFEFKLKSGNGESETWLKFDAKCSKDPFKGKVINGVLSDISDTKRAHIEVVDENDQLFQMLDSFPGFAYLQAPDYTIKYANKHFIEQFGGPGSGLCYEAIAGRTSPCPTCPTFDIFKGKNFVHWEAHNTKDKRIYDVYDMPFYGEDGQLYVLEYGLDITEKVETEQQLKLHSKVFQEAEEAMIIADHRKRVIAVNPAFEKTVGYISNDVIGQSLLNTCLGSTDAELNIDVELHLNRDGYWRGEVWRSTKGGTSVATLQSISKVKDKHEGVTHYIASITNITEMAEHYRELQKIVHLDPLTGIPNRTLLDDRLEQAIKSCEREKRVMVVIYIDLDNFKDINSNYGHCAGDHVLKEVSKRLVGVLRSEDTVARVGGDEFMVLMPNVPNPSQFETAIKRLQQVFVQPVNYKQEYIDVGASLGSCFFPNDADSKFSLIERADKAMYNAKETGKNRFMMYQEKS